MNRECTCVYQEYRPLVSSKEPQEEKDEKECADDAVDHNENDCDNETHYKQGDSIIGVVDKLHFIIHEIIILSYAIENDDFRGLYKWKEHVGMKFLDIQDRLDAISERLVEINNE